ncbi:MAG: hypothetical protein D6722_10045 [Bacteroidetes bacterium]|nr:MAG: hypothetical protein D6722_10045 [Bacteroidota bacterium]
MLNLSISVEGFHSPLNVGNTPREDIVLGFQAPYKRPYTDFAVA